MKTLYKRTKSGDVQQWEIRVENNSDGTANIIVTHGLVNGQKQVETETISEGKNAGRKNATSPWEQAEKEAEAKWSKKRDREHYGLTVEESDMKISAAPMLAHVYEDHAKKIDWNSGLVAAQPKFDGHRCLAFRDTDYNIQLFSRKGDPIESCPHIIEQLKLIMPTNSIFDGELYIHGRPLNEIASLIRRAQEGSANLCYIVYDTVDKNRPFHERFLGLSGRFYTPDARECTHLHLARTETVKSEEAAFEFQQQCLENGYEGAMLRHGDYDYESGKRSHGLLKMKTFRDGEFVVVGAKEGRGKFEGMAIFVCQTESGSTFEVTAPGTHDQKRAYWANHQQFVGQKLTVKFQNLSATENAVPIFPVALGFANNKDA